MTKKNKKRQLRIIDRLVIFVLFLAFCSAPITMAATSLPSEPECPYSLSAIAPSTDLSECFHKDKCWRGSDCAASIALNRKTSVWIFGDTYVLWAKKSGVTEKAFVNNTVARQNLDTHAMEFYWKNESPDGMPTAMFTPEQKGAWYWPGDGCMVDGKMYVVNKVVVKDPAKEGILSFDWVADALVQISNPNDSPRQWKTKSALLPENNKTVLIGTACYVDADYAYFFTSLPKFVKDFNFHPNGLSRVARNDLASLTMSNFEFWNGVGWSRNASDSVMLVADGASEMTVTAMKGEPYLVMTYMPPLSTDIQLRFARKPEGPWSKPLKIYQCPEGNITVLDRKVWVYSAKNHPELASKDGALTISYCSLPGEQKHMDARPDIYWPRLISVKLAPVPGNAGVLPESSHN